MEGNSLKIKAEPIFNHNVNVFSVSVNNIHDKGHTNPVGSAILHDCKQLLSVQADPNQRRIELAPSYIDPSRYSLPIVTKVEFYSPGNVDHTINDTPYDSCLNVSCKDSLLGGLSETSNVCSTYTENVTVSKDGFDPPESVEPVCTKSSTTVKPSEALFVRALIGRCKRIAPLWFRGVSSMRERNREENRRMANNSGQSQSDWSLIGRKIAEMDAAAETDAVANLLKKLYKELPADSVFWFLKCWLRSEDSLQDPDSCVISRGDAKGRMRRIDGGKGSDKVWRLDTIVGMLYHGLPMSSTDTNIMVHTCDQELCVRPQHIRFRASSVALVVVLKALSQAGYTVIPPPVPAGPNGVAPNASDESVDVFGPFTIDELQQYRSENLKPVDEPAGKLSLSATDREFANSIPVVRAALQSSNTDITTNLNGIHRPGPFSNDNLFTGTVKTSLSPLTACSQPVLLDRSILNKTLPPPYSINNYPPISDNVSSTCISSSMVPVHRPDRRSLKRPAPTDSPCSFPSSPSSRPRSHHPPTTSPPLLIPDSISPSIHSQCTHRGSGTILQAPVPIQTSAVPAHLLSLSSTISPAPCNNTISLVGGLRFSTLADSVNSVSYIDQQSDSSPNLFRTTTTMKPCGLNGAPASPGLLSQSYPLLHATSLTTLCQMPGQSMLQQISSIDHVPSSNSGKNTPRQPAKKRLEARTPTIEGLEDGIGANAVTRHAHSSPTCSVDDPSVSAVGVIGAGIGCNTTTPITTTLSAFRVHQNTPFVPVPCRSGRPGSSGSSSTTSGGPLTCTTGMHKDSNPARKLSDFDSVSCDLVDPEGANRARLATAVSSNGHPNADEEDEEEELMGIMVGRSSGSGASGGSVLHTPANTIALGHKGTGDTNQMSSFTAVTPTSKLSLALASRYPQLGASPTCERHAIQMIGALLASSYGSPLLGSGTPVNPRRSASACSLPFVGNSPNGNITDPREPCGNMGISRVSFPTVLSHHCQSNDSSASATRAIRPTTLFPYSHARKTDSSISRLMTSTPPPRLSPSGVAVFPDDANSTELTDAPQLSASRSAYTQGSTSSGREFMNFIRNSPASGITPELVDVLYNMAQQYGMCQPRAGSRASRPSSQVAQHFYRSLVNGSVCGSPYPIQTPGCTTQTSACLPSGSDPTNDLSISNTNPTRSSVLSPTSNCCTLSSSLHALGSHPMHHLRGLSITPLAVDPDPSGNTSSISDSVCTDVEIVSTPLQSQDPAIFFSLKTSNHSNELAARIGTSSYSCSQMDQTTYSSHRRALKQ